MRTEEKDTDREKQRFLAGYAQADRTVARRIEELRRAQEFERRIEALCPEGAGEAPGCLREAERELAESVRGWMRARRAVEEAVGEVEDPKLREVLERRYLQGESLRCVAEAMHYSERHVARMHRRALDALRIPATV